MRTIDFNGYIDDEQWCGDEVTPDALRNQLFGEDGANTDDVAIKLNSYGGSCFAATRMYDLIKEYPGNVTVTISGCAASAATVVASAGDAVNITPGSVYMIHDPSTFACGNAKDMQACIDELTAVKASILNVYMRKCKRTRDEVSALMENTTWMDAETAVNDGFCDAVVESRAKENGATNAAVPRVFDRAAAERKVRAWQDRRMGGKPAKPETPANTNPSSDDEPKNTIPITQLDKRLALLKH